MFGVYDLSLIGCHVLRTCRNSIHGSAVCAFRMSDVLRVFEGAFKEQLNPHSNWLRVSEIDTPHPHPAKVRVHFRVCQL